MRLVTYLYERQSRIGYIHGEYVIDVNTAYVELLKFQGYLRAEQIAEAFIPPRMTDFLQGGKESMEKAQEAISFAKEQVDKQDHAIFRLLSEVKLTAPVPAPEKIICVGHNYREHILEMGREIPSTPVVFAKMRNTLIGPQDDIPHYPISEQLDYEVELAVVIGKRARNVSQSEALNYVAGYTIANDVTYRDIQRRTIQWLQGKTVEHTLPMGPHLVTADELDASQLDISLSVNGEERQRSNTKNLVFTVPFLIEFLSNLLTLEPGDIILTGTPGGVGVAMNPATYLKDGDIVQLNIEGIGTLTNKVRGV